jgi:glycine cleavage system aminomethyltransferase T
MTRNCQIEKASHKTVRALTLTAFESLHTLFVRSGNPGQIAYEIGMPAKDAVMFFDRFGEAAHIDCKQLQTLR